MKRSMGGGSARGPVAHQRQRRTIRFMQGLLAVVAAGLFAYAIVALLRVVGFEQSDAIDAAQAPSLMQPLVLALGALVAAAAAAVLGGREGVRLPTPARLEELVGRAERAAVDRAEASAGTSREAEEEAAGSRRS